MTRSASGSTTRPARRALATYGAQLRPLEANLIEAVPGNEIRLARVEDIAAPVLLWYGDDDEIAPPDHGRWLAAHLASAHLTVYEGQGHLLPLAHWDEMLRALTAPA